MPPCFTFSSRSPPKAEPEQHDDLANAFSSAFDRLSLGNDHPVPGHSATAVEAASSNTGNVFLSSACSGSPLF